MARKDLTPCILSERMNFDEKSSSTLKELFDGEHCEDFDKKEFLFRVHSLKPGVERNILFGAELPILVGKINLEKKIERIKLLNEEFEKELNELVVPYVKILTKYKERQ